MPITNFVAETPAAASASASSRTENVGTIKGQLKLTVDYHKDALHVMVRHAKNLAIPDGSRDEPNSYVKVYLRPDHHKATKRKTRVVRKNCHPSFMEMVSESASRAGPATIFKSPEQVVKPMTNGH